MKAIAIGLFGLLSIGTFAQEHEVSEEFLPVNVEGKEAYMSTKTGEFTFREHDKTDPTQLKTTPSGVVYTDISTHTVKKGETLSTIAKKNEVSVAEIKAHNNITNGNLKIGSSLKIVKKILVKSSSPVVSYVGRERIIAKLRPGESPGQFAPPPSIEDVENKVIKTEKTQEKASATVYKAETSIKNPIFGLEDDAKETKAVVENEAALNKKERLAKLKAEMKALEAELEKEEEKEEEIESKISAPVETVEEIVEEKIDAKPSIESKEQETNALEKVKASNPNAKIEEDKEGKKVIVFENKPLEKEESTAEKAKQVIASVRKTEKEIEASKKIDKEKEALIESTSKESNEDKNNKEDVSYYTVEKGNSLWSIARMHNMTVDDVKKLNNLKNNNLTIGQKLKVTPKK